MHPLGLQPLLRWDKCTAFWHPFISPYLYRLMQPWWGWTEKRLILTACRPNSCPWGDEKGKKEREVSRCQSWHFPAMSKGLFEHARQGIPKVGSLSQKKKKHSPERQRSLYFQWSIYSRFQRKPLPCFSLFRVSYERLAWGYPVSFFRSFFLSFMVLSDEKRGCITCSDRKVFQLHKRREPNPFSMWRLLVPKRSVGEYESFLSSSNRFRNGVYSPESFRGENQKG